MSVAAWRVYAAQPETVGTARRFVAGMLNAAGIPAATVADAVLCVSELATNAVVHAPAGAYVVRVAVEDRRVRVEVADEGTDPVALDVPALPETDAEGGRGLYLMCQAGGLYTEPRADRPGRCVGVVLALPATGPTAGDEGVS